MILTPLERQWMKSLTLWVKDMIRVGLEPEFEDDTTRAMFIECQHPKLVDSFVSTILVLFRTPDNFVRYMFSFYMSPYNPISHSGRIELIRLTRTNRRQTSDDE